ncbi:MAG: hypothetical protein AB1465_06485 [Patescibacteria group bacterium]
MKSPIKIIVEGGNLSGKTSIVKELEKKFVHSIIVTLHGYYHPFFLENIKNSKAALRYHRQRLLSFLPIFKDIKFEELIFNRFHLTASVYLKLFYNLEDYFLEIEKVLNNIGVFLILADFNNEALEKRLKERKEMNKEAPFGDDNLSKIKKKRDLYRLFFEKSKIQNKLLIDNSQITANQACDYIQEKIK